MPSAKVLYAVRLPTDLKRLIDAAAASGGVSTSQLVVAALWQYLERGSSAGRANSASDAPTVAPQVAAQVREVAGSIPAPAAKPTMQALRDICAGKVAGVGALEREEHVPTTTVPAEVVPQACPYTEYDRDTGETYGCALNAHGPKIKHVRGPALA